ncbi:MAG: response regulator [Magnetospirillum sp.]
MSPDRDVVLVVDDDPTNILVLSQTLRPDYDVLFATDAHKGLELVGQRQPGLILLDVMMPVMDGYELCRRLKADPLTADIPVVFITSLEEQEAEIKGLQCGAVDYIPKPFNPPVVRARVHNHMEMVRARRRLAHTNRQLEEAGRMVASGIRYASRIQGAMLPDLQRLDGLVAETAVWWKPFDVVGGDFYWAGKLGDKVVFALIDCTGHGVPGAFMAVVAAASLAQVLRDNRDGDPASMLNGLNQAFRHMLRQDDGGPAADDGFDAALCVLDPRCQHLSFAGANMHLLISDTDGTRRLRGERMGLGYATSPHDARLTTHEITLAAQTTCYLFSDGIVDNMGGGERPQLFGWRRLAEQLDQHRTAPLSEQIAAVKAGLAQWCGDQKQRDDMTLLAFRP